MKHIHTFSIAAYDSATNSWGIAVTSKFLACTSLVAWARAGAGAVATQSLANLDYGDLGLKLLAKGYSAQKTLAAMLELDSDTDERQVGVVDSKGESAAFTGKGCLDWAGHKTGPGFSCQGNMLASDRVVPAVAETFLKNSEMPFARRLVTALAAGDAEGGDRRGKQSAGVLVVTPRGSYGGYTDRAVDLRVDDHAKPVTELLRLLDLHDLYFGKPKEILPIEGETQKKLLNALCKLGYLKTSANGWDAAAARAFVEFSNTENFEERLLDGNRIDGEVLAFMLKMTEK